MLIWYETDAEKILGIPHPTASLHIPFCCRLWWKASCLVAENARLRSGETHTQSEVGKVDSI